MKRLILAALLLSVCNVNAARLVRIQSQLTTNSNVSVNDSAGYCETPFYNWKYDPLHTKNVASCNTGNSTYTTVSEAKITTSSTVCNGIALKLNLSADLQSSDPQVTYSGWAFAGIMNNDMSNGMYYKIEPDQGQPNDPTEKVVIHVYLHAEADIERYPCNLIGPFELGIPNTITHPVMVAKNPTSTSTPFPEDKIVWSCPEADLSQRPMITRSGYFVANIGDIIGISMNLFFPELAAQRDILGSASAVLELGILPYKTTQVLDFDENGIIGPGDLKQLAAEWTNPVDENNEKFDLDCSKSIGLEDLAIFARHWYTLPGDTSIF